MKVCSFSAKGSRQNNEDFILSRQISTDSSLYLIADGMGGYSYGEIASSLTCESIAEYFILNDDKLETKQLIFNSLNFANGKMYEKREELLAKMGATVAGILIKEGLAYIFWVGDVRVYQFRKNEILFQSEDHSFINELKKKGEVSAKEIARYSNIVTKSISGNPLEDNSDIVILSYKQDDILIICTDGFWQRVDVSSVFNFSVDDILKEVNENERCMDDNYSFLRIQL